MRLICFLLVLFMCVSCGGSSSSSNDSQSEREYVALGASDATGIGASPLTNGYVFQIHESLNANEEDFDLINLGIPGAEADDVVDTELPVATNVGPELVTIWLGANDVVAGRSPSDFGLNISDILAELRRDTGASIFIATVPDLTRLPRYISEPDPDVTLERIQLFNDRIRSAAMQFNATIVDLSAVAFDESEVSDDGFHPNDEGHQLIASLFLEAIRGSSL